MLERRKFGHRIGGINPEAVEELFGNVSEEVAVNDLPGAAGAQGLTNHGQGPAFMIEVTWIAKHITLDAESFELDAKKQKEAKYRRSMNSMPTSPGHLAPGEAAELTRIPTFLILDPCKQIKEIEGDIEISYRDAFGKCWKTVQEFRIIPQYMEKESRCVYIFTDIKRLPTIQ